MTSTYSTVINFSIKDLIYRIIGIYKLRQINDIMNDLSGEFKFPREERQKNIKNIKCPNI